MTTITTDDALIVLRALWHAATQITEDESDGYGACRYCHAEDYPVDADGEPAEDEAIAEYRMDHEPWCPSAIIDDAFDGVDDAVCERVLKAVTP